MTSFDVSMTSELEADTVMVLLENREVLTSCADWTMLSSDEELGGWSESEVIVAVEV